MKNEKNVLITRIGLKISLCIFLLIPLYSVSQKAVRKLRAPSSINVAIYPYIPRYQQFVDMLTQAWNQLGTGVQLNFVNYDCYSSDPPPNLDVFVFDGIYYKYFMSRHYLKQLSTSNITDWMGFMNYAWNAVWVSPNTVFAIPYLGCSNVYFYRKSDPGLDTLRQNGLDAFYSIIGNSPSPQNPQPPQRQGLLMDLSGSTTDATLYLMAQMNLANNYSANPYLPPASQLDPNAINHLHQYTNMTGLAQGTYIDTTNQRIAWFSHGFGRSLVGITENLCSFPQSYLDSVSFRILPTADTYLPITEEFFVDMAAINSQVSSDKLFYAIQLLNLMTSQQVMYNSMIPQANNQNPQFLIPVRGKVLADLMNVHPLYIKMAGMIFNYYIQPLVIGSASRYWLTNTKSAIRAAILSGTQARKNRPNVKMARPELNGTSPEKEGRFNSRRSF